MGHRLFLTFSVSLFCHFFYSGDWATMNAILFPMKPLFHVVVATFHEMQFSAPPFLTASRAGISITLQCGIQYIISLPEVLLSANKSPR